MLETPEERRQRWLHALPRPSYLTRRHRLRHRHDRWRKTAELLRLSRAARGRLEWLIFWERHGKNVTLTGRHFGIARKTFYKWSTRFDAHFLRGLEDESRGPRRRRQPEYTPRQYERVVRLRRAHLRYGKFKLLELYRAQYPEDWQLSSWKVRASSKPAVSITTPPNRRA